MNEYESEYDENINNENGDDRLSSSNQFINNKTSIKTIFQNISP